MFTGVTFGFYNEDTTCSTKSYAVITNDGVSDRIHDSFFESIEYE